jgi:hypothetical protein
MPGLHDYPSDDCWPTAVSALRFLETEPWSTLVDKTCQKMSGNCSLTLYCAFRGHLRIEAVRAAWRDVSTWVTL